MNKIPRLREPRGQVVQQVRDLFLERHYKQTPELFYADDVKQIENMEFLLQRYIIMQRKDVEQSVEMVAQMLKWRKEKQLRELNDRRLPRELTLVGGAFLYENDNFGNRTLYLRASLCKNCTELKTAMKQFLTYLLYKLDDSKDGTTYAVIMDLTDCTLSNYDIDLLTHIVSLLKDYFPVNMDYFLAINFPWILSAAWSLIKRLIPTEKRDAVQFINSDKIFDFVPKENCPDFLGGTCTRPYAYDNPEGPTIIEYLQHNIQKPISHKRLKEILALFSETLPKNHLNILKKHIDQLKDGLKVQEDLISNNNNNNGSNENLNKSALANESVTNQKVQPKKSSSRKVK